MEFSISVLSGIKSKTNFYSTKNCVKSSTSAAAIRPIKKPSLIGLLDTKGKMIQFPRNTPTVRNRTDTIFIVLVSLKLRLIEVTKNGLRHKRPLIYVNDHCCSFRLFELSVWKFSAINQGR